jgi:hypothetical protein
MPFPLKLASPQPRACESEGLPEKVEPPLRPVPASSGPPRCPREDRQRFSGRRGRLEERWARRPARITFPADGARGQTGEHVQLNKCKSQLADRSWFVPLWLEGLRTSRFACLRRNVAGMGAALGLWGSPPDEADDGTEDDGGGFSESTGTEDVPGGIVDGRVGSRGSRSSGLTGKLPSSERAPELSVRDYKDADVDAAYDAYGDPGRPERVPGLIPFTTVPFDVSYADEIYDEALMHGFVPAPGIISRTLVRGRVVHGPQGAAAPRCRWLSVVDRASRTQHERWCAVEITRRQPQLPSPSLHVPSPRPHARGRGQVHAYHIYEFEPLGSQMDLKRSAPRRRAAPPDGFAAAYHVPRAHHPFALPSL